MNEQLIARLKSALAEMGTSIAHQRLEIEAQRATISLLRREAVELTNELAAARELLERMRPEVAKSALVTEVITRGIDRRRGRK